MTAVLRSFRRLYGHNPLHLLIQLGALALAGYAATRVLAENAPWEALLVWFVGAAVLHDVLFLPLYAIADVTAHLRLFRRHRRLPAVAGVAWINHLRFPVAVSALLMLVWFPLILGGRDADFRAATGLGTELYLGRWLAVTGVLFVGSALLYALRVRRAGQAGRRAGVATAQTMPLALVDDLHRTLVSSENGRHGRAPCPDPGRTGPPA